MAGVRAGLSRGTVYEQCDNSKNLYGIDHLQDGDANAAKSERSTLR